MKKNPQEIIQAVVLSDILFRDKTMPKAEPRTEGTIISIERGEAEHLAACQKVMLGSRRELEEKSKEIKDALIEKAKKEEEAAKKRLAKVAA